MMNRKLLAAALAMCAIASTGCASIQAEARITAAARLEAPVAILPVAVEAIDSQIAFEMVGTIDPMTAAKPLKPRERLSMRVTESLQRAFVGKGPWTIIDRTRTDAVTDEMVLQLGDFIDEHTRAEFGRKIAAKIVVTATARIGTDGAPSLAADAIVVETGVIVWSAQARGDVNGTYGDTFDALAQAVAEKVLAEIAKP